MAGPWGIQEAFLGEEASTVRAAESIVVSLLRKCQQMTRSVQTERMKCQKVGIQKSQMG